MTMGLPTGYLTALRRLLMLAAVFLFATGWVMKNSAKEFFEGRPLALAQALASGDPQQMRELAKGLDLNKKGKKDMSFMWFAIQAGNFVAVKTLVELGVNPDEQIADGLGSALDYALLNRDLRFLAAMLDGGFPVNYQDADNASVLHRAAGAGGSLEHVKLLVGSGANLQLRNSLGQEALQAALDTNHADIAAYLIDRGADVHAHDDLGVSVAYAVQDTIKSQRPGPLRSEFERLRQLMITKGVKFPPDPPAVVRDQMRARGETPVVPAGHDK